MLIAAVQSILLWTALQITCRSVAGSRLHLYALLELLALPSSSLKMTPNITTCLVLMVSVLRLSALALDDADRAQAAGLLGDAGLMAGVHHSAHILV